MAKINAFFETFLDEELYEKIHSRSKVIRAYCMVKLRTDGGFTEPFPAIIDTGAHTSLIPFRLWKLSEHKILGDHYVKGLVPNARLDVKVGELSAVLIDLWNTSKEYTFLCFFAPDDNTPLILGFKELLSHFKLVFDYKENITYLEENER